MDSIQNRIAFPIDKYFMGNAGGTTSLSDLFADVEEEQNIMAKPASSQAGDSSAGAAATDSVAETTPSLSGSSSTVGDKPQGTAHNTEAQPSNSRGYPRFSKRTRSVLRIWFNSHLSNPYPTPEEREELQEQSGLNRKQITLWLANARRRHQAQYRTAEHEVYSSNPNTAVGISPTSGLMLPPAVPTLSGAPQSDLHDLETQLANMNPFERWRSDINVNNEPASFGDIVSAVAQSPAPAPDVPSISGSYPASLTGSSTFDTSHNFAWGHSMASFDTSISSMMAPSDASDFGCMVEAPRRSSVIEKSHVTVPKPKISRRRCASRHKANQTSSLVNTGLFWCTFCPERRFGTKHDWQRHESSQHLSVESWACCINGGISTVAEGTVCTFCRKPDPDAAHLEKHSYSACQEKEVSKRMFYRKDHFQQHLRLVHGCKYTPYMNSWKTEISDVKSSCGFCGVGFEKWQERCDHIAAHFRGEATMTDWHGPRGLAV